MVSKKLGRILLAAAAIGLASAQAFEVASIKPSEPGGHGVQIQIAPGGRLVAKNVNVKFLIQQAYGVRDFQITGGPGWIGSERYDIVAKPEGEGDVTPDQLKPMIQALLAERFKLTLHRETKELPVYALVVAKNGPKLQEVEGGPTKTKGAQMRMGRGLLNAQAVSMTMLATSLSNQLGRSVIDKTGLTGNYDVKLEWTPDEGQSFGPKEGGPEGAPPPPSASGPSIFTAVQEQLGLKLEPQKGPVEILIIDRIEKATEN